MSDPQQGTPRDDQIPPIPPAPDAQPPQATPAPPAPSGTEAAPLPVQPPAAGTFAPPPAGNPYVQTPFNPYAPQGHNPYVQPVQGAPAPSEPSNQPTVSQPAPPAADPHAAVTPAPVVPPVEPGAPAPTGSAQPAYAQPAYAQPAYAQPAYAQPGYGPGAYAPGQPSRLNVLGLVSLIAGGVAFLFGLGLAWIPFLGFFFVLIALVGLGLGIVGLLAKNKGKGLAIAGTIVSGLALLITAAISILMLSIVSALEGVEPYDPGYSASDDESVDVADEGDFLVVPDVAVDPDVEIFQPGDTLVFADYDGQDEWVVTVGDPVLDATREVLAAANYNPEPPAGAQYVVVPLTITYLGEDRALPLTVTGTLITTAGEGHRLHWAVYDDSIYDAEELGKGDTAEVSAIFLVPSDDVSGSVLELSTFWADGYVAIG